MAMSLQQEEQEIKNARDQVKRMLELHEKTTKSLAARGLNVQESKAELEENRRRLAAAEAGTFVPGYSQRP